MVQRVRKIAPQTPGGTETEVRQALQELGISANSKLYQPQTFQRRVKNSIKRGLFYLYKFCQRWGVNLFPSHYYTAEPNVWELERNQRDWLRPSALLGIDNNPQKQLAALQNVALPYQAEFGHNLAYASGVNGGFGPGFGYVEAMCLHAVVRSYQPQRVIEVGSGVSTLCISVAALLNHTLDETPRVKLTCVEPYPSTPLLSLGNRVPGVTVRRELVQQTPNEIFEGLKANDILFIDSSHVARTGSDVIHLVLEVLPRLAPGVLVHIHDIYLPYEYQRDVLKTFMHHNETPFVHAFLAFNNRFEILFSLSQLHYSNPKALQAIFPGYQPEKAVEGLEVKSRERAEHFPSSLWLRVKK